MRSRWFTAFTVGLSLALVAGCGSTSHKTARAKHGNAPNAGGLTAEGGNGAAAAAGGSTQASQGGQASGTASKKSGSSVKSSARGTGAAAPGAPGSAGVSSAFVPANGPGITNTDIYMAVGFSSQSAAGDRAIGAGGAAPSYDTRDVFNAVIKYANAHGGFAGRRLSPIFYDYNLTTNKSTQDQAACANYTQDHKVFTIVAGNDILDECAEKAHAVAVGGGSGTAATYQKFPHLISPDGFRLDRLGNVTANGLFKAGYFTGKLGLVTWDDPNYRFAISQGYLPALSSHQITPTDTAYIVVPQTIDALSDSSAAISSAITKFRSEGIDHVIIQDGPAGVFAGAGLTFEWMNQAKSQRWYPRYGQNASNAPGWSVLPSDQMDHAIAIDYSDYDAKYDEGWHPNASREKCFKIQSDAGYPVSSSNLNDEAIAALSCDLVFFSQQVINSLSSLSNDAFVEGTGRLGTAFPPAVVYGDKLVPGRRDGGDLVRTEEYLASCSCLKYSGPPYSAES